MTVRRRPTKAIIQSVIARQEGRCGCGCGRRLNGSVEWDHVLPLALGGTNEADNWQALLRDCHVAKTSGDIRRIRKADRQRLYHETGRSSARKIRRKIPNRGFPKRPADRGVRL